MVNYGSGQLGDETISTNTTKKNPVLEYQNLTVEEGAVLTLQSRSRLMVTDTLTVDGEIKVLPDISGSGSGGPKGGDSGGNLELMAKTINGSGMIRADASNGSSGNNQGNRNNGGNGAAYSIPATSATGSGGSSAGKGSDAIDDYESNWNGNRNGGSGGGAYSSVYNDSALKPYIEDYLISGAYITQSPLDTLLPGSGSAGAGGGSQQLDDPQRNNNYRDYRVEIGGGGGGAGGSFVSQGGTGGNGADSYKTSNGELNNNSPNNNNSSYAQVKGGEAGAGGGAGGFILLVCENVSLDVTFSAKGGPGGDGYWGSIDGRNYDSNDTAQNFTNENPEMSGGGGGGGAGGLVIGFADKTPSLDLAGGDGGIPGGLRYDGNNTSGNAGKPGQDGVTFIYDVKELL